MKQASVNCLFGVINYVWSKPMFRDLSEECGIAEVMRLCGWSTLYNLFHTVGLVTLSYTGAFMHWLIFP